MFQLTPLPINISYWIQQAQRPEIGAMELFIGISRNHKEDQGILALYYEAYEEMVGKSALSLEKTIKERYPSIQELVIITASHRKSLFQAMDECVDLIKKNLPIWKKGIYEDGHEQWLTNQF